MTKRIALVWLAVSSGLALLCFFFDRPEAFWTFSLLVASQPAALIAIGVSRESRREPLRSAIVALAALMTSVVALLLVSINGASLSTVFGFPASSLLALGGLWLLPLILTTAVYAATFRELGLREEDLRKIRQLRHDPENGSQQKQD